MVDTETLKAIARLAGDSDFRVFMEEVQRRKEAARDALEAAADPWNAGRSQGESRLASELIQLVSEARKSLQQRQQPPRPPTRWLPDTA